MAKAKEPKVPQEGETKSKEDKILSYLEKEFGKGIIQNGTSFLQKPISQIEISPSTNVGMGPIIEGSWIVISGEPKTGKSIFALYAASQCQKPRNGGRNVYYISAECRVHKRDIQTIGDMDPDKLFIIQSNEDNILSAEKMLQIVEHVLHHDPGCVVIIDSQSALCSDAELTAEIGSQIRAPGHHSFAQFVRKCGPVVPAKKAIVFVIVHMAPNLTGYGGPREKENTAMKYQKDYHIRATKVEDWEDDNGKKIGLRTTWKTFTTRTGMRNTEFITQTRFGSGIDERYELAILINQYASVIDGMEKNGAYFYFPGFQEGLKCQGEKQLYQLFVDSDELYLWCKEKLDEFLKQA